MAGIHSDADGAQAPVDAPAPNASAVDAAEQQTPPKGPSLDDIEFADILAALYKVQRKEFERSLEELLKAQQLKGPPNLIDWVNRLTPDPASPLLTGQGGTLIACVNLPGASTIHIEQNRITACHNGEPLTPHTAMAMATLALADPVMREKGIELEGTEEEQIVLFMALRLHGFDKILNPPKFDPQNNQKHAEIYHRVMNDWPVYVAHERATAQPKPAAEQTVANENAPKNETPAAEPVAEAVKAAETAAVTTQPVAEAPKAEEAQQAPAPVVAPVAAPVAATEQQVQQPAAAPQQPGDSKWLHPDLHNQIAKDHADALIASNPNKPVMPERLVNFWNKRIDDKAKAKYLADLNLNDPFIDSPVLPLQPTSTEEPATPPVMEEIKPIREMKIEPETPVQEVAAVEPAAAEPVTVEEAPVVAPVKAKKTRTPKKETIAAPAAETATEAKPKRVRKPKAPAGAFDKAAAASKTTVTETKVNETKIDETTTAVTTTQTTVSKNIFNGASAITLPHRHVFLPQNSGWDKLSAAMQDRLQEYVGAIFKESYPGAKLPAQKDIIAFWDAKQPEERVELLNEIIANEERNAAADVALRALKSEANAAFAGNVLAGPEKTPAAPETRKPRRGEKTSIPRNG